MMPSYIFRRPHHSIDDFLQAYGAGRRLDPIELRLALRRDAGHAATAREVSVAQGHPSSVQLLSLERTGLEFSDHGHGLSSILQEPVHRRSQKGKKKKVLTLIIVTY